MTAQEFKAWFSGYTEALPPGSAPTPAQFQRIADQVHRLDGITYAYGPRPYQYTTGYATLTNPGALLSGSAQVNVPVHGYGQTGPQVDSMEALGRAEFANPVKRGAD